MKNLFGKSLEEVAIERIREFEPAEGYYVAFSGGKDSITVLNLVKQAGVKYDAHYALTTVDHPEVVRFIRTEYPEVEIMKPKLSMWQLIVKNSMPPTRLIRYCCRELKEEGGGGRFVITGVRWSESSKRSRRRMIEVCRKDKTKHLLHAIIDWDETDVWQYIRSHNLKYPSLYDKGYKRLGCIGCPMASDRVKQLEDNPKYKQAYIRAFERILKVKDISREDVKKWHTAQDVYDFWISDKSGNKDEECMLFD